MRLAVEALSVALVPWVAAAQEAAPCGTDVDCPGDQLCSGGRCSSPPTRSCPTNPRLWEEASAPEKKRILEVCRAEGARPVMRAAPGEEQQSARPAGSASCPTHPRVWEEASAPEKKRILDICRAQGLHPAMPTAREHADEDRPDKVRGPSTCPPSRREWEAASAPEKKAMLVYCREHPPDGGN